MQTALQTFVGDLDLIAACANAAIRAPAKNEMAEMPEEYAKHEPQERYPRATLPENLPKPKAGKMVDVPDFTGCKDWGACHAAASAVGLEPEQVRMPDGDQFQVLDVSPPTRRRVPEGTVVRITYQPARVVPQPPDKRFHLGVLTGTIGVLRPT